METPKEKGDNYLVKIGKTDRVYVGNKHGETESKVKDIPTSSKPENNGAIRSPESDCENSRARNPLTKLRCYERKKGKPKVLIICNWEFETMENLLGYKKDAENLKHMWERLGCEVYVKENLKKEEIKETVAYFSQGILGVKCYHVDNTDKTFTAVFILSHGARGDEICGIDSFCLPISEILQLFDNIKNEKMRGMPKLLFFQACRGKNEYKGVVSPNGDQSQQSFLVPHISDIFVAHSCQSDTMSYVHPESGSFFIQAIVEVFNEFADKEHLLDLMTMVNEETAGEPIEYEGKSVMVMSEFRSSLRKKLWLNHNEPTSEERHEDQN